jgi:DNA primase
MTTKRFSTEELFRVRNEVPIDEVIEHIVGLPCKVRDGHLRFLCPVCSETTTATNPKTNLARCFRCARNFNAIDMVMVVQGVGFVEAVKCLKTHLQERAAV